MKQFILVLAYSAFCSVTFSQSKLTIDSDIKSAAIYNQGATLTRAAEFSVKQGANTIVIGNLPIDMDESSVGIKLSSGAILLSQKLERKFVDFSLIRSRYEEEKRSIMDSIDMVNASIEVLQGQEILLNSNRTLSSKDESFSIAELIKLNDYYGNEMQVIKEKILFFRIELRDLQKRINQLNAQMNEEGLYEKRGESQLILELEAEKPSAMRAEVEYFTPNAGWTPKYDLRMEGLDKDLKLVYKAAVYQNTGEDWHDVAIVLSTAQPRMDYILPELSPYYLDFYDYPERMRPLGAGRAQASEEDAVMAYAKAAPNGMEVAQSPVVTNLVKTQTSINYSIDHPYSINSTGVEQTVIFKIEEIPVKYGYVSVPKITATAFLTAKIANWEALNVQYGEANIFIENRYSGKTYIGEDQYQDEYIISMGKDDQVSVKRELKKGFSKAKFIGNNKVDTREWSLSVKNNKAKSISMTLYDQYPVSQNGLIKVDLKDDGKAQKNEDKGLLTWEMTIAPSGIWERSFEYEAKYPQDRIINFD